MSAGLEVGMIHIPDRPGSHRQPCPECARAKHRPKDDAVAVTVRPDGSAIWLCHRCGWSGSTAGERHERRPRRPPAVLPAVPEPEAQHRALVEAIRVWRASLPITADCTAGKYLLGRGCCLPHPDGDLRWSPDQWRSPDWSGPALVALVTDAVTNKPMTLHRTWLARDGSDKVPIEKPRLIWKGLPKKGGVCRLYPDEEVTMGLLVGEGIETVLSAARGFGLGWACLDKANLAAFPVLAGIEALTIVADHDPDGGGQRAAEACARRWAAGGVEAVVWSGKPGQDFNDFVRSAA